MPLGIALFAWLVCTVVFDLRYRRVPNWLVLAGALIALAALPLDLQPFGIGWATAGLGAAAGFLFLLIFYAVKLMGAGDVKFAGALGLWVGLQPLLPIWIGASLLAGVHSVLWLLLWRKPDDKEKRKRHIPYAAYMALATLGWMAWRQSGA